MEINAAIKALDDKLNASNDTIESQNTIVIESIENLCLNIQESAKILGLIIDEKLNWYLHINKKKSKINSASFALRKLNNILLPSSAKWFFVFIHVLCRISHI